MSRARQHKTRASKHIEPRNPIWITGLNVLNYPGVVLFSRGLVPQVSSPQQRFTAVFGKGTGGSTALETPEICGSSPCGGSAYWSRCIASQMTDLPLPLFGNRRARNFMCLLSIVERVDSLCRHAMICLVLPNQFVYRGL